MSDEKSELNDSFKRRTFSSEMLLKSLANHGYNDIFVFFTKEFSKKYKTLWWNIIS